MLSNIDIKNLTPQREPILMVDNIIDYSENEATTTLTITPYNMFVVDGVFTELGLIEHVAQSLSSRAGYKALLNNEPIVLGFIGEVKQFRISSLPKVGNTLTTKTCFISQAGEVSLYSAEVCVNGTIIASGKMKIFLDK